MLGGFGAIDVKISKKDKFLDFYSGGTSMDDSSSDKVTESWTPGVIGGR